MRRSAVVADEQGGARHQALHVAPGARCGNTWNCARTALASSAGPARTPAAARRSADGPATSTKPFDAARFCRPPTQTDAARRRAGSERRLSCDQSRARDLRSGNPQPEHRRSQMFRRVHRAFFAQDLLRPRNLVRIEPAKAMMPEPDAELRARSQRHPHAARAAMKVQRHVRRRAAYVADEISSTSGLPSKTPAKRGSTTTRIRKSGR